VGIVIIGLISIIIVGAMSGLLMNEKEVNKTQNSIPINNPENKKIIDTTQKSGPFQINKSEYRLGEKIFFRVMELQDNDKGEIVFIRPIDDTFSTPYEIIPFDGGLKSSFNQYIEPKLLKSKNTCDKNSLIGTWSIWFRGTEYKEIEFEIINKDLPGEEGSYNTPVC